MATLQVGSKTWVVLNSNRVVNEIINKRGSLTNGRPDYPVASDLASLGKRSIMLKVPEWTERRRVTHSILSGTALKGYAEYQDVESVRVLARYLRRPELWFQHHALYAAAVIYRVAFGKSISSLSPTLTTSLRQVHESFITQYLPPNNTMDCFPQLSHMPRSLQWWRKPAEQLGRRSHAVYKQFWDPVHQEIVSGNAPPSFARDVLIGQGARFTGSDDDAMFLSGELIEAGGDTTRLSLNIFAMAAACYPAAIQKARDEIDAVCGSDAQRLPAFHDEPRLRYVLALAKELLRWRPIIAWGTEHTLTEPLEFEAYRFPAATHFVINSVATCSDPQVFEEPQDFKPERWLDGHEGDVLHGSTAFGGGRRVCVGYRLAQKSLFINISRLIYCFDFHPVSDVPLGKWCTFFCRQQHQLGNAPRKTMMAN